MRRTVPGKRFSIEHNNGFFTRTYVIEHFARATGKLANAHRFHSSIMPRASPRVRGKPKPGVEIISKLFALQFQGSLLSKVRDQAFAAVRLWMRRQ